MLGSLPFFSKKSITQRESIPSQSASRLKKSNLNTIESGRSLIRRVQIQDIFKVEQSSEKSVPRWEQMQVPIFSLERKRQWIYLNPVSEQSRKKKISRFARGKLVGIFNEEGQISKEVDFVGNFEGVFESGESKPNEVYQFYFEGNISQLKILRIQGQEVTSHKQLKYQGFTSFLGYFKGLVVQNYDDPWQIQESLQQMKNLTRNQIKQYEQLIIRSTLCPLREYFVPALARFQIGKIREICLQQSSAKIWGTLFLDIQMNSQISDMLRVQWQAKRKHKFHVNFNRSIPFDFPFYDPAEFQATEEETQYQWDDIWEGIHWTIFWNADRHRMEYCIETLFTVELDNSHGVFFAPFNLTILRIIITLHSITINQNCVMHISVGDLQDFNGYDQSGQIKEYTPHTEFSELETDEESDQLDKKYEKHIDRLSKISSPSGRDVGQYKIATNRLFLFPYHNRRFVNSNTQISDWAWLLGLASRTAYFRKPEVLSLKDSYKRAVCENCTEKKRAEVFVVQRWNYVHIQIPIYKYPVIDLIRIFVPIVILASIGQLIFGQQNGSSKGFPLFAKRIASSCSLLIAYVALIPLIRGNLPPIPSLTLIEIVIYLSTVPNFLAVLSVYFTGDVQVSTFFQEYRPFYDALFQISFLICTISFVLMVILVSIYISKKYKAQFTFKKYKTSSINRICSPHYLEYMEKVKKVRRELALQTHHVVYDRV